MCAHLTAHAHKCARRIQDYHHIVGSLLFPPLPGTDSGALTTIFSTSHLFFFGDLNFRVDFPPESELSELSRVEDAARILEQESVREDVKEYDQLLVERDQKGSVFVGLREGEFWKFKCSYKYKLGEVDRYEYGFLTAFLIRIRAVTDAFVEIVARNVCQPGPTESCTPPTQIPPIPHVYQISQTPCIPLYPPTLPPTMYATSSSVFLSLTS